MKGEKGGQRNEHNEQNQDAKHPHTNKNYTATPLKKNESHTHNKSKAQLGNKRLRHYQARQNNIMDDELKMMATTAFLLCVAL